VQPNETQCFERLLELISSQRARIGRAGLVVVPAERCIYGSIKEDSESLFSNNASGSEHTEKNRAVV